LKGYQYLTELEVPANHLEYRGGKSSLLAGLFATRVFDETDAERLAKEIIDTGYETVLVGHSNGTAMAAKICEYISHCAPESRNIIKGVVSFNGALNAAYNWPWWLGFVHNYYNPGDWIVKYIAKWRIGHIWGSFGATEYTGTYSRCTSFNMRSNLFHPMDALEPHSQVWENRSDLTYWMDKMMHEVNSEMIQSAG